MINKLVIVILFLCVSIKIYCNQEDSLLNLLSKSKDATKKVELYIRLSNLALSNNQKKSELYASEAIKIGLSSKSLDSLLLLAYMNKSRSLYLQGKLEDAIKITDSVITLTTKQNNLKFTYAAYKLKGHIYRRKRNFTESLKYFLQSEEVGKQMKNDTIMADVYSSFGTLYSTQKDYIRSEKYHLKSLDYILKVKDTIGATYAYENLGILKRNQKKYNDAINYYMKALNIRVVIKDTSGIAFSYNDIGAAYSFLNKTKEADFFLKKSILLREQMNELIELAYTYNYLGENDERRGDLVSAERNIKKALQIAQQIKNDKQTIEAYESLSDFYTRIKKSDSALLYLKKFVAYRDSINTITQNELTTELTIKYETAEKDKLIKEQQWLITKRTYTIIVIVISIVVIGVIIYLLANRKALQQKAQQQQQLTKAIVEAEEAERKRIASDLHDGVGQLFSAVKMNLNGLLDRIEIPKQEDKFLAEKTMALVDESCKEVRVISHKMMPNFLLKSGIASDIRSFIEKIDEHSLKIHFETKGFKEQLEFNEEVILYRVIQELINNVIKHAEANELQLLLERTGKEIIVQIADNGKGFNYETAKAKGGLGLKNILVRIEYLKGAIQFLPNQPKGTLVKIQIPIA